MGPYCRYCDTRCFVPRQILVGGNVIWSGIMATCSQGKEYDRNLHGQDADTAHNPARRNQHNVLLTEIVVGAKVTLQAFGDEVEARVRRMDTEQFGVADLLGYRYGEELVFDVADVLWIDPMCNCGSYDCKGECCGVGFCTCSAPVVHRSPLPGEGLTPCCGQHPSDLGRSQLTVDQGMVTCSGS